jgi:ribosome-associated toxin RatA of RatAB toxin-antitoxin module
VHITKGPWQRSFTTVNELIPHQQINMRLKEGPFRFLEGCWTFTPLQDQCNVSLALAFEFSNPLLSVTISPILKQMTGPLFQAFIQRAHDVYDQRF